MTYRFLHQFVNLFLALFFFFYQRCEEGKVVRMCERHYILSTLIRGILFCFNTPSIITFQRLFFPFSPPYLVMFYSCSFNSNQITLYLYKFAYWNQGTLNCVYEMNECERLRI